MENENLNNSNTSAFYIRYYKKYFWTKEEAIALSLSLDPSNSIPKQLQKEYDTRMELLAQAMESDGILVLKGPLLKGFGAYQGCVVQWPEVTPSSFISWVKKQNLSFPPELEDLVRKHYPDDERNWKSEYELLETENNHKDELLKKQEQEINELRDKLKPLHGGERNAWAKLGAWLLLMNYGDLSFCEKNIDTLARDIIKELESNEHFFTDSPMDQKTMRTKLELVHKYCKKHKNLK